MQIETIRVIVQFKSINYDWLLKYGKSCVGAVGEVLLIFVTVQMSSILYNYLINGSQKQKLQCSKGLRGQR